MVRTRKTRKRGTRTRQSQRLTLPEIKRQQQKQKQARDKYVRELQSSVSGYFDKLNNISNLDSKASAFISRNITKVPPQFRNQFRGIVLQSARKQKQKQRKIIDRVKGQVEISQKRESRADDADDREEELQFRKQKEAWQEALNRLKKGQRLKYDNILDFVKSKTAQVRKEQRAKEERKKALNTEANLNIYIREQAKKGKTPSVKEIKDKFNVSLKTASEAKKATTKSKPSTTEPQISKLNDKMLNTLFDTANKEINLFKKPEQQSRDIRAVPFKNKDANKIYQNLAQKDKNKILSYIYIRQTKRNVLSQRSIDKLEQDVKDINKLNSLLRKDPNLQNVINLKLKKIPRRVDISKDIKNARQIFKLSDREIQQKIRRGELNVTQKADSINKLVQLQEDLNKAKILGTADKIKKEVRRLKQQSKFINIGNLKLEIAKKPFKQLVLFANLKVLENKLKSGKRITKSEFRGIIESIDDAIGLKGLKRRFKSKNERINKLILPEFIKDITRVYEIAKFTGKTAYQTVRIFIRDLVTLFNLGKIVVKATGRLGRDIVLDISDAIRSKLPKNKNEQIKLWKRLSGRFDKAKNKIKFLKNNLPLFGLGLAIMVSQGQRTIRRTIINEPEKAIGEVASFFVPGRVLVPVAKKTKKFTKFIKKIIKKRIFNNKLRKSLVKNVNADVIPTDFKQESIEALLRKKKRGTIILGDDGEPLLIIGKRLKGSTKQLQLLKESSFKKFFPKLEIPPLKKNPKKIFISKDLSVEVLSKRKITQRTLDDFLEIAKKKSNALDKKISVPEFKPKKTVYLREINGEIIRIEAPVKNKVKLKQSTLNSLLGSKKGQARLRLLEPKKIKNIISSLDQRKKDLQAVKKTLNKAKSNITIRKMLKAVSGSLLAIAKIRNVLKDTLKLREKATLRKVEKLKKVKKATKTLKKRAKARKTLRKKARAIAKQEPMLKAKTKQKTKKIPKLKLPKSAKPPKFPKLKLPKIKLSWDKKPKDKEFLVDALFKRKGKIRRLNLQTTKNRAIKYVSRLIDSTPARSFQLLIVGVTNNKDVSEPSLIKFRRKRSNNPKVLKFVEKSKYAIDTPGEKRGLKLAKKNKSTKIRKTSSKKSTRRKKKSSKKSKVRSRSKRSKKKRN